MAKIIGELFLLDKTICDVFIGLIIDVFLENPQENLIQYVQMKVSDVIFISGLLSH